MAGIITSAPMSNVPTALIPRATIKATKNKKMKLFLATFVPEDFARSDDIVLRMNPLEISFITIIITMEKTNARIASRRVTLVMSPNKASNISSWGVIKIPIAKENVKNKPTRDSVDSSVLVSISQMPIIPMSNVQNAPRKGLT